MSEKKPLAFVIMPFDEEFNRIYEDLIREPLEEAGFDVKRADSFLDQHNIMKDIVRSISDADLILAELTAANPNVYYELGLAHGLRRPTILLTQNVSNIPFDLRAYRFLSYSTHYKDVQTFTAKLKEVAEKTRRKELGFSSPVGDYVDAASAPAAVNTALGGQEVTTQDAEPGAGPGEPGIIDARVDFEDAAAVIVSCIAAISKTTQDATDRLDRHNQDLVTLNDAQDPNFARKAQAKLNEIAYDLAAFADGLDKDVAPLAPAWEKFAEAGQVLLAHADSLPSEKRAEEAASAADLLKSIAEARVSVEESAEKLRSLKGVSRALNRGVEKATASLERVIRTYSVGESHAQRFLNVLGMSTG